MHRRDFLRHCLTTTSLVAAHQLLGCANVGSTLSPADREQVAGLQIIDPHSHPYQFHASRATGDPSTPTFEMITQLGMAACAFAAVGDWVKYPGRSGIPYGNTRQQLARAWAFEDGKQVRFIRTAADLQHPAAPTDSPRGILAIEGGDALQGNLAHLDVFFEAGVRIITVLHDHNNEIGVNQRSEADGPLTPFGAKVIERMNALGLVVDVAHAKTGTLKGIVEATRAPIIDSHTSLIPPGSNPSRPTRLRTWTEMEWIAKTGGVVCTWPFAYSRSGAARTTVQHWAQEILDMKRRLGIEHCALGTDGGGSLPEFVAGWTSIASLPTLIRAMREAGLSQEDIFAYTGGNIRRILAKCLA